MLPIITSIVRNEQTDSKEPLAIILSPTRELAVQIQREGLKFAQGIAEIESF